MELTKSYLKNLTYKVTGAIIEVHKHLGSGLLESVYHKCLKHELALRGIEFKSELNVPVHFKGLNLDTDLKCDLFVENILPIELKSVKEILPIHEAQLLTYMKLLDAPKGLLINFNVKNVYNEGHKTFVNELFRNLKE